MTSPVRNSLKVESAIVGCGGLRPRLCNRRTARLSPSSRAGLESAVEKFARRQNVSHLQTSSICAINVEGSRTCGTWLAASAPGKIGGRWLRFDESCVRSISRTSRDVPSTMPWRLPDSTNRRSRCFTYHRVHRSCCTRRVRLPCRRQYSHVTIGIGCSPR